MLLIGPPGSGKTTRLLAHAHTLMAQGKRVWWVALPSQRSYVYRRATERGALLGLEVLSSQQVYYRLLAAAQRLKPLVIGTGRIALVGEALKILRNDLPSPGEARLFARAIAEAKRFGLSWQQLPTGDSEAERFAAVFRQYEQVKGERWDYDDFRTEALRLAQSGDVRRETDCIIVDGFRELGPLELRLYQTLGERLEVHVSLPDAPPGVSATETLSARPRTPVRAYRAANPVAEARWVLRALKRDLAEGVAPLDLAVVLPERDISAFLALADEYGVALMGETPKALADTPGGRYLMDLLELPDHPSASRLLTLPELAPLANAALARRVAGREALTLLATELGLNKVWGAWLERLEVPEDALLWARGLVESLPDGLRVHQEHFMARAKEAAVLATGASFRAWWGALLNETQVFARPKGGVALLSHTLVSGRRFKKVYLLRATEGRYSVGEGEDYFIAEDNRESLETVFANTHLNTVIRSDARGEIPPAPLNIPKGDDEGRDKQRPLAKRTPPPYQGGAGGDYLPKRLLGRDTLLYQELLTRGDEVIVTYPEADQGGPLVAQTELVGVGPPPLPEVPVGSRLELAQGECHRARLGALALGPVSVQGLYHYDRCAFQYWADKRLGGDRVRPWWQALRDDLREWNRLSDARFALLSERYGEARDWLRDHRDTLFALSYGVALPEESTGPRATLDAAGRTGRAARLYLLSAPGIITTPAEARALVENRWNELWAAAHLLGERRVESVQVLVWPVLGEPIDAFGGPIRQLERRARAQQYKVQRAYARFVAGDVGPTTGFHCRACRVFDLCREGKR